MQTANIPSPLLEGILAIFDVLVLRSLRGDPEDVHHLPDARMLILAVALAQHGGEANLTILLRESHGDVLDVGVVLDLDLHALVSGIQHTAAGEVACSAHVAVHYALLVRRERARERGEASWVRQTEDIVESSPMELKACDRRGILDHRRRERQAAALKQSFRALGRNLQPALPIWLGPVDVVGEGESLNAIL